MFSLCFRFSNFLEFKKFWISTSLRSCITSDQNVYNLFTSLKFWIFYKFNCWLFLLRYFLNTNISNLIYFFLYISRELYNTQRTIMTYLHEFPFMYIFRWSSNIRNIFRVHLRSNWIQEIRFSSVWVFIPKKKKKKLTI